MDNDQQAFGHRSERRDDRNGRDPGGDRYDYSAVRLDSGLERAAANDGIRLTAGGTHWDGPGKTVQEVHLVCDFEGELTLAVGVSGQRRFRVEAFADPPRLVLDVPW